MIRLTGVTFAYDSAPPALADVSAHVGDGDLALVVGRTGSGKSTLLGLLNGLVPHFTGGTLRGDVSVATRRTSVNRPRDLADVVGYVGQNPLHGFVTDTVEEEIAYGMEQLGIDPTAMRKRVEETLDLMGIADLRRRPLPDLSGGQQQRVAIAAVLAAQPRVLVLDEPTSALDPTAAQDVLAALTTLVHEVGLTVVLAEHRLERVMQAADKVLWLPGDGSLITGEPRSVLARTDVVPPLAALAHRLGWTEVPLTVREARRRIAKSGIDIVPPPQVEPTAGDVALKAHNITVSYGDIRAVKGVTIDFRAGEVTAIMGRNGSGKSSLLHAIQGVVRSTGDVSAGGVDPRSLAAREARRHVTLVPQSAADLLYLPTVAAECVQADRESDAVPGTTAALLRRLGADLDPQANPRDLSEGQRLSLVLAIQLAAAPSIVLLDEPTRGLDYRMKSELSRILAELTTTGKCVVVVTHDVEFVALATQRAVVMAEGEIVADGTTRDVCAASPTFAPQMAKVFAPLRVLTAQEVVRA